MPGAFNPFDWYWFIGADQTKVYSSQRNIYVDAAVDGSYQLWRSGNYTAMMADEVEVWGYMKDILPAWMFDGTTFSQPAEGQYSKTQLQSYAQLVRDNTFYKGMVAEGIPVATDPAGTQRMLLARQAATDDSAFQTTILGTDGNLYPVTAATIISVSNDMIAMSASCADTYANVHDQIDTGTITSLQQIDQAFSGVAKNWKGKKAQK